MLLCDIEGGGFTKFDIKFTHKRIKKKRKEKKEKMTKLTREEYHSELFDINLYVV